MKKAVIIVHSKTGITRMYAEEIEEYLQGKEIEVVSVSIRDYRNGLCGDADYLLLGCWTSGLMFFMQHPDKEWKTFASHFEDASGTKTMMFTTYKILTGSMFRTMTKLLAGKTNPPSAFLKSRNGTLSENDKSILDSFCQ